MNLFTCQQYTGHFPNGPIWNLLHHSLLFVPPFFLFSVRMFCTGDCAVQILPRFSTTHLPTYPCNLEPLYLASTLTLQGNTSAFFLFSWESCAPVTVLCRHCSFLPRFSTTPFPLQLRTTIFGEEILENVVHQWLCYALPRFSTTPLPRATWNHDIWHRESYWHSRIISLK